MSPYAVSVTSVMVLLIGVVLTVGGFYISATGGVVYMLVAGVVCIVAGVVISALDMRGYFSGFTVPSDDSTKPKSKGGRR